ncbi:MAG: bifunctional D-glycero-beta-D-manno-heptose-7-phosphate kinase/D-glycero-beta-D-manno-heptose 1-phosphate adenylyltransferase HldE [Pseudomonadales bacterium]
MHDLQLPSLRDIHILVVGDLMVDRYWHGPARRVSQEAPVPVIDVVREEERPGGAANVALNVASLGARCTLIGVVGDDAAGAALRRQLEAAGVTCEFVTPANFRTIVKLRLVSQRQQLLRADFETPVPDVRDEVERRTAALLTGASALVLEDTTRARLPIAALIAKARTAAVPVVVDPKAKPFSVYAGADVLKPNDAEFRLAAGAWEDDEAMHARARAACETHGLGALVVTRGRLGIDVVPATGAARHIPAHEVEVFDVTGAGDTVTAILAIGTALEWDIVRSSRLANHGASLVVAKQGTATVSGPELAYAVARRDGRDRGVLTREQLVDAVARAREGGERIVFTNGCFDLLHAGHVAYLEEARQLGDRLVVAVNDDASVARLDKGPNRPVNALDRRMRVLAGLAAVDWVVGFPEDTPEVLLQLLRPDVLVKGGDYAPDQVVGHEIVTGYGGTVRVLGLVEDCSTTAMLRRIQSAE